MTIPSLVTRADTLEAMRAKINSLIAHVDQIEEANLNDTSYFEEFQAADSSNWDLLGTSPGSITGSTVGYTYEQNGTTSSGYYVASLNGNQSAGTYTGSAYSKRAFNIGSNVGNGWEFHFRVGANWNSVADSPIARTFTIGIINTTTHPSAHATMGSHDESYFFQFFKNSHGTTSDMTVSLEKGTGGSAWSTTNISSNVTFTQGNAGFAPNPWYVLSFRYTTNLLQAFVNGVYVSQVVNPFTFGSQESVKIGSNHALTIGTPVSGSLMTFRTDYVHVVGKNTRAFTALP